MSDIPHTKSTQPVHAVPDHIAKALREKDKIIRVQAKRIGLLENDVDKLKKERDSLSTKVTLLTYKLQSVEMSSHLSVEETEETTREDFR